MQRIFFNRIQALITLTRQKFLRDFQQFAGHLHPPLFEAVHCDDAAQLNNLLSEQKYPIKHRRALLNYALFNNFQKAAKTLSDNLQTIPSPDEHIQMALFLAAQCGCKYVVELLLKSNLEHNVIIFDAFAIAVVCGQFNVVQYMVDKCGERLLIELDDSILSLAIVGDGIKSMSACAFKHTGGDHLEIIKFILKNKPIDYTTIEDFEILNSCIVLAARTGGLEILDYLLDANPEISQQQCSHALQTLIEENNYRLDIINKLLTNINTCQSKSLALECAAKHGCLDIVQALLQDPEINITDVCILKEKNEVCFADHASLRWGVKNKHKLVVVELYKFYRDNNIPLPEDLFKDENAAGRLIIKAWQEQKELAGFVAYSFFTGYIDAKNPTQSRPPIIEFNIIKNILQGGYALFAEKNLCIEQDIEQDVRNCYEIKFNK